MRLIGLLARQKLGETFSFTRSSKDVGSVVTLKFSLLDKVDFGSNLVCLLLREEEPAGAGGGRLFLVFPYFNPRGPLEFVFSGLKFGSEGIEDNRNASLLGFAKEIVKNEVVVKRLKEHGNRDIVLTGFSMGGALSNLVAYELIENEGCLSDVTVIAFGNAKPGNAKFSEWFGTHLNGDSKNILAVKAEGDDLLIDPVGLTPNFEKGFDHHPSLYLLREGGDLGAATGGEKDLLKQKAAEQSEKKSVGLMTFSNLTSSLFGKGKDPSQKAYDALHQVLTYYEFTVV
uniref:Fungal lipase-type domain-containing protein n=1 Tax=Chromera velia CCMP2878 TaxID=1169474 RepID=A0A0G4GPI1_9ALVE|eukprot:Cvel_22818.t1-p1 / transcript=Cvel_22818.t1 / gene=Cvel_22818 / organism=Chromera_velia_CCMP2878 / gene_product=hypothetical protein / transcript_product=hypothetical protein / location=Cvel_scaffold2285:10696-11550(-) / protein_length=285 / sequence_SO=supercontig / SO=protein_coding / is_pseudo=false